MSDLIIRSVRICDFASTLNGKTVDVFIQDGVIVKYEIADIIELNGKGLTIMPALFDMQVHCGEPGHEERDDLESLSKAALAGGFSDVMLVSGENPVTDSRQQVEYLINRSKTLPVQFHIAGALTEQMQGLNLAGIHDMRLGGACAFFDHLKAIEKEQIILLGMQYTSLTGGLLIVMPDVSGLRMGGMVHEGHESVKLGLKGSPALAEEAAIERFIRLAQFNQTAIHISGISSAGAVHLIREAKSKGILVTCSVFVQNLVLTDASLHDFDTNFKVWPPLRAEADRTALIEGVLDGTIDVICSNHKSLTVEEKLVEFEFAHFGIVGLESALGLLIDLFGQQALEILNRTMNVNPRKLLGLPAQSIEEGRQANFLVLDTDAEYAFDPSILKSKQQNTPFGGKQLKGKVHGVFTSGKWFPC